MKKDLEIYVLRSIRIHFAFCFVLLLAVPCSGLGQLVDCSPSSPDTDAGSCQQRESRHIVESDLLAEHFDQLDSKAERYRQNKSRTSGGDWSLWQFYSELAEGQPGDERAIDYISHLERWVQQRPDSITARVALVTGYLRWASAGTLKTNGLYLGNNLIVHRQRIEKARVVLESSAHMSSMCPQWYWEAMMVGLSSGWDTTRIRDIFEKGIQFELGYFYLYRRYALYLWHADQPGDLGFDSTRSVPDMGHPELASALAKSSADRLGGTHGDQLYFRIAAGLMTSRDPGGFAVAFGSGFPSDMLDWGRIQRGYQALATEYHISQRTINEMALMAWKFKDPETARQQFAIIGGRFSSEVWGDRKRFDQARKWCGASS
ncbi:hypothetical protein [Granulicella sp. S156]|uniref:hypothetical protein n=1 Tax=Granulicella sp. S156 TaxID=1747224 RepID=UPI00131BEE2F|nr:hypothetical protein [Granulicella sp. S156]